MNKKTTLLTFCLGLMTISPLFAQLEQQLTDWTEQAKIIAQLVVGLAAVGGGYTHILKYRLMTEEPAKEL